MRDKRDVMRLHIKNGIRDLNGIRESYNTFADGGNIYDGPTDKTNQMSPLKPQQSSYQFYQGQYNPELKKKIEARVEANKPVNTTSEFVYDFKTKRSIRNPNAKMGLEIVSPEFMVMTGGVGGLATKATTTAGKMGASALHGAGQGAMANMANLSGSKQNLSGLTTDVLGGAVIGGGLKGIGLGAKPVARYALDKTEPYLMGDKNIPMSGYKPKSNFIDNTNDGFVSEIDWNKWNEEIPKNTELINEYNLIEKTAKNNGTWMKPVRDNGWEKSYERIVLRDARKALEAGEINGRKLTDSQIELMRRNVDKYSEMERTSMLYDGTPEQFVQEHSKNYKKAFGENKDFTYRGASGNRSFKGSLDQSENENLGSIFTADKDAAIHYGGSNPISSSTGDKSGYLELIYNKTNNNLNLGNQKGIGWRNVRMPDGSELSTDDIAKLIEQNNIDYATLENIFDGTNVSKEVIFNHKKGNYLKSRIGNNGMFDMSNPNIYKSLIPAGLFGYGLAQTE